MDYKIVEKDAFTVLGNARTFGYEKAEEKIPVFWTEHYETGKGEKVCGKYGVNIDESMGSDEFEYLIADDCEADAVVPEGFCKVTIPDDLRRDIRPWQSSSSLLREICHGCIRAGHIGAGRAAYAIYRVSSSGQRKNSSCIQKGKMLELT